MRRLWLLLAITALAPLNVHAQGTKVVGPDPASPSTLQSLGNYHALWYQSFRAPPGATRLLSYSFSWAPTPVSPLDYFVRADVGRSAEDLPEGLFGGGLDLSASGWYTLLFDMPVRPSEMLFFHMLAGNGRRDIFPSQYAHVRLSDPDTYAEGGFYSVYDGGEELGDMLFRAEFAVVPEPVTLLLLGTGLVGIIGVAVRRRGAARVD